jgi:hypothetical protein
MNTKSSFNFQNDRLKNKYLKKNQESEEQETTWKGTQNLNNLKSLKNDTSIQSTMNFSKLTANKKLNRSFSTDLNYNKHKLDKSNSSCTTARIPLSKLNQDNNIQSVSIKDYKDSLIKMHKILKEKKIYSHPKDNYKRRTIILVRNSSQNQNTTLPSDVNSEFGFHLESYGLVNTATQMTEFICFVNNVQPNSPAKQAGLQNGDVILAVDSIEINKFKDLNEIMRHVHGILYLNLRFLID